MGLLVERRPMRMPGRGYLYRTSFDNMLFDNQPAKTRLVPSGHT
jgi:hypothetical protein